MDKKINKGTLIFDILYLAIIFIFGLFAGAIVGVAMVQEKNISLKQESEIYVKENEWKNEYIEWLQDRLYKYEEGVSYEIH